MNLLTYVLGVWARQIIQYTVIKAFKSLKAYKYFFDGYVRNAWVHQCPCDNNLMLKVLYFCAYIHHLYNRDAPLEVFISTNEEHGNQSAHVNQDKVNVNGYNLPVLFNPFTATLLELHN